MQKVTIFGTVMEILSMAHVSNIPTMQFFTGISGNTQSKSYTLSLTECVWENSALWDIGIRELGFYKITPKMAT